MAARLTSVLFLCGENALRSPMAEGLLRRLYGDRLYVQSAGLRRGALDALAVEAMAQIGVDISSHVPKQLDELDDGAFDLVIALSAEARDAARALAGASAAEALDWSIDDPSLAEGSRSAMLAAYGAVRDALRERIARDIGPRAGSPLP
jgi:protein-tyrosine-phosphatase